VRLEVLTTELLNVEDGAILTLFRLVHIFRRSEGLYCLHLQCQAGEKRLDCCRLKVKELLFRNIGTLYPTTELNIPEDSHIEGKGSVLINTTPEMPYVEMEV
jgi:hypothetical protein